MVDLIRYDEIYVKMLAANEDSDAASLVRCALTFCLSFPEAALRIKGIHRRECECKKCSRTRDRRKYGIT